MSVDALTWAKKQKCGAPAGKLLLMLLADYANEEGYSYPRRERIADETELSLRTVYTWIGKLEDLGLLSQVKRRSTTGLYSNRMYKLHLDGTCVEHPSADIAGSSVKHSGTEVEPPSEDIADGEGSSTGNCRSPYKRTTNNY